VAVAVFWPKAPVLVQAGALVRMVTFG